VSIRIILVCLWVCGIVRGCGSGPPHMYKNGVLQQQ